MQIKDIRHKKLSELPFLFIKLLNIRLFRMSHLFQKGVLFIGRKGYREFLLSLCGYIYRNKHNIIPGIRTNYNRWMKKNKITDIRIDDNGVKSTFDPCEIKDNAEIKANAGIY